LSVCDTHLPIVFLPLFSSFFITAVYQATFLFFS
jgi:hypothetical protein